MGMTRRFRFSLGGMILLVALIAIAIAYLRPDTRGLVDVKVGTGPPVKAGDRVSVHYTGILTGGKVFDSSKARNQPFEFVVGRGTVIRGWEVGLLGMRAGGVRRLTIPPEQAYGDRGAPPLIPPRSTLYFEVELLKIQ